MVTINYPGMPQGPDIGGGLALGLQGLGELIDNKRANKAYEQYDAWLRGGQQGQQPQQPMSLASLGQQGGQVQRSPLPPVQDAASQRVSQAHGDMGGEIFSRFMKTVQAGGVTNPAALAAIASTGKHESGFSDKNAYGTWDDPSQSGEAGTSGGIMSWRGPRLQALQQFAQANGDNANAPKPETQAQFLLQEDPSLIQKLQQVRSPQEAQQLMNNAWRFAGYDQQGGEAGARVQTAQEFAGQFGGQGQGQDAMSAMTAPQGQPASQAAPQGNSGSLLPPADVMRALFKSEQTRPLAIQLAQSAQAARQGDPEAALKLEKMRLEVENLRNPQAKPTSSMQEYEFARSQGFQGTFQDYELAGKKAGATNVNVGNGEGGEFFKELDKQNAQMFGSLQQDGVSAGQNLVRINRLDSLLQNVPTGTAANFKQIAGNYGINTEGLDDIQAAQALINQIVPTQRPAGSGPMSDADLDLFKQSVPRIINQPGGNKIIIDTMRGIAEYTQQQGRIADAVANREITPAEGRKQLASLANPLEGVAGGGDGPPKQGAVVDGYRFKGGDPADQNSWEPAQ